VCRLEETTFQANEIVGIRGKELILVAAMATIEKLCAQVVVRHFFKWVLCRPQFLSESGKSNYMVRSQRISNISLKSNFYQLTQKHGEEKCIQFLVFPNKFSVSIANSTLEVWAMCFA
jgi:hypothetical protein